MAPLYRDHELLLKGKISRREFIKRAVATGVVTPALLGFLQGCTSAEIPTPTEELEAGPVTYSPPEGLTKEITQARPLIFQTWETATYIVEAATKRFEEQYNETVDYRTIPGDYSAVAFNKLISGAPLDMVFTQQQGPKWYKAGFLMDLNVLWDIEQIKSECLPAALEMMTFEGAIVGLPHFNSVKGMICTNEILREKAGLKDEPYPANYEELYAEVKELKKQGVCDFPFLPFWAPAHYGIMQYFCAECLSRGDEMWDEEHNAIFGPDTIAAQVLEDWHMLYVDKISPEGVLTWGDADRMDALNSGQHVYGVCQSYDIGRFNDPNASTIAGSAKFIPCTDEQGWGMMDYALYSLVSKPSDTPKQFIERLLQFVRFMGYKDKEGIHFAHKKWVIERYLGSAYPAVNDDPDVDASYRKWMPDYPQMKYDMEEAFRRAKPNYGWKAIWFPDWDSFCQPELAKAIMGEKSVEEVMTSVRDKWMELKGLFTT